MGQIFNPSGSIYSTPGAVAGGAQVLAANGASIGQAMGTTTAVVAASTINGWGNATPPWVSSFSDSLGGTRTGLIKCAVAGAIIRCDIEIKAIATSGTLLDVQCNLVQNVSGSGGSGSNVNFTSEPTIKNAFPNSTANSEWVFFTFLYQFTNAAPPTDTLLFQYIVNASVAGSANSYSQMKCYRVG